MWAKCLIKTNIKSLYIKARSDCCDQMQTVLICMSLQQMRQNSWAVWSFSPVMSLGSCQSSPHEKQLSKKKLWRVQSAVKILAAMSSNSQSTPSNKFSPVTALQPMIHQWWVLILSRASAWRNTHCGSSLINPTVIWHEFKSAITI